jgi:cell division protein FtsI/penicillin-binding protein 2
VSHTPVPMLAASERRRRRARQRRRRRLAAAGVVLIAVVAALVLTETSFLRGSQRGSPAGAAQALARALPADRLAALTFANVSGRSAERAWLSIGARMAGATATVRVVRPHARGGEASATLQWRWRLPGGRVWAYSTPLALRYEGNAWKPVWSVGLVNRQLRPGERLSLALQMPRRAQLLSANGQQILRPRSVVNVGIEPDRVHNLRRLARELHQLLGVAVAPLVAAVRAAPPTDFVPVTTLPLAQYDALEAQIYPLPGTVFTTATVETGPTPSFAASVLGVTGTASAAMAKASHGTVLAGETVGLTGLEAGFNATLAGLPGVLVHAVPLRGHGKWRTLFSVAARAGTSVRTTIQTAAQEAADQALAGVTKPSALIALNIATGAIIAVSVGPDADGYDTAIQGEYPPGSTFKVATTLALLEGGEQTDDTVDCPSTITVDGRTFHNAEHEVLGEVSFAEDFAHSCNTAFISLAPKVPGDALPAAASTLGIGRSYAVGVPVFSGSIPVPGGALDLAAEAFGQGQDLVSPLALAAAAAAVARGRWIAPYLNASATGHRPEGPRIAASIDQTLQELMRDVVLEGTGTALADQPGLPVYGKTGTAETGDGVPPLTDAWFIGFQGNIAFAALVADTKNGFGGVVAAPIIGRFLDALDT